MGKIFILALMFLLISGIFFMVRLDHKKIEVEEKNNLNHKNKYYGPVPLGYDQEYFWETGKMKLED